MTALGFCFIHDDGFRRLTLHPEHRPLELSRLLVSMVVDATGRPRKR